MKTKALMFFLNRSAHFDADIEAADIFRTAVENGALTSPEFLFDYCDSVKHPTIAGRRNKPNGRMAVVKHLQVTLQVAYLKELYEDFSIYLSDLLVSAAKKGLAPDRLIGEHRFSLEANDILKLGSWDSLVAHLSTMLFRRLENEQSTVKLIAAIDAKLALKIDASLLAAALPFLDLRHLLVHADGYLDKEFCDKYPAWNSKPGDRAPLSNDLILKARLAVHALVLDIDAKVLTLKIAHSDDLQP